MKPRLIHGRRSLKGFRFAAVSAALATTPLALGASITVSSLDPPRTIPDGSLAGITSTVSVGEEWRSYSVNDIVVTLTLGGVPGAGGEPWAGDYYAYLHHDGKVAVLLNRVGKQTADAEDFGYDNPGFQNVRISDQFSNDIHTYQVSFSSAGALQGDWAPDGRANAGIGLTSDSRSAMLSTFDADTPAGNWNLFLADMSPGSVGQLQSWAIELTAALVPEPAEYAVAVAAALLGFAFLRRQHRAAQAAGPSRNPQVEFPPRP